MILDIVMNIVIGIATVIVSFLTIKSFVKNPKNYTPFFFGIAFFIESIVVFLYNIIKIYHINNIGLNYSIHVIDTAALFSVGVFILSIMFSLREYSKKTKMMIKDIYFSVFVIVTFFSIYFYNFLDFDFNYVGDYFRKAQLTSREWLDYYHEGIQIIGLLTMIIILPNPKNIILLKIGAFFLIFSEAIQLYNISAYQYYNEFLFILENIVVIPGFPLMAIGMYKMYQDKLKKEKQKQIKKED